MATAGGIALKHRRLSKPQLFSALNLVALLVHQYEEYEDPGYFPGQFNGGLFHSEEPSMSIAYARQAIVWLGRSSRHPPYHPTSCSDSQVFQLET
jgi:hypothetical protein